MGRDNPQDELVTDFDVILPVYNGERWLSKSIESVLGQTCQSFCLYIIDDGSTDGSAKILNSYAEDSRIVLLWNPENLKAPASRMEAIGRGRSLLIAFIDQDDLWAPDKLSQQLALMNAHPEVGVVCGNVELIDENGAILIGAAEKENSKRARIFSDITAENQVEKIFLDSGIRILTATVRRRALVEVGGFDRTLFGGEEWDFWLRLGLTTWNFSHVPQVVAYRRKHGGNVSVVFRRQRSKGLLVAYKKNRPMLELSSRVLRLREEKIFGRLINGERKSGSRKGALGYAILFFLTTSQRRLKDLKDILRLVVKRF